jgi:dynamin 1-like protein
MHACIHAHILTRTRSYTRVILPFLTLNIDLTNSAALEIARPVDPQGRWTIGSLTKLELGMHTLKLTGFMYLLKLGSMES